MYENLFREQPDPSSLEAYVVPDGQPIVLRPKLQSLLILMIEECKLFRRKNVDAELLEGLLPIYNVEDSLYSPEPPVQLSWVL